MNDDARLLRRYAEEGSEVAFTELVRRYIDLVYGAALRRTGGDAHAAADVSQQVFTTLARQAGKLSRHTVLSAWLHTATRNAAINLMISDQRRKARESEAVARDVVAVTGQQSPDWERLRPLLDASIDELPETDRTAVILRFLEHRAFAEIGAVLKISEDAARMRTDRALDKLRLTLARRGIASTATALATVMASQPLISAPSGLAAALAAESLTLAGTGSLAAIFASFMNLKLITTTSIAALLAFGTGTYVGLNRDRDLSPAPAPEVARGSNVIASLRQDNQHLQTEIARLHADIARLNEANSQIVAKRVAPPPESKPEPRTLTLGLERWEVQQAALNNLRQIDAARKQFQLDKGGIAGSISELVGRGGYIKVVRTVDGEDYSGLSMIPGQPLTVTTTTGITVTYDPAGVGTTRPDVPPEEMRKQRIEASMHQAVEAYRAAHQGARPPSEKALLPYFATPEQGADFVEFIEAQKAAKR